MSVVYVSVGSNIDREYNLRSGVKALTAAFGELTLSSVYDSQAVGFEGHAFYNLVAAFETDDDVYAVNKLFAQIERDHKRTRKHRGMVPRTLDLDLLLFDDLILNEDGLKLPRDEITRYAFVLGPLAEIAGDRRHPFNGKRISILWDNFDASRQPMQQLMSFDWDLVVEPAKPVKVAKESSRNLESTQDQGKVDAEKSVESGDGATNEI